MATVPSATGTPPASSSSVVSNQEIASNFTTFLQLLTTQLKNQDPMSPMDTNQFTQQLVQFAQVEQQMQQNSQLSTLVTLQSTAQSTAALSYVGATVAIDGSTARLTDSSATWNLNAAKPGTATLTVTDSTGNTVYSSKRAVSAGAQQFVWNGLSNTGSQLPDGTYKLTVTAVDATNQPLAVSSEVQGKVDSVDLTQNPPVLSINGGNYTIAQIKRIIAN